VDTESAIAALYDAHAGKLYAYARALVGDQSAAEDVVHEVFVKVIRLLSRGRGDGIGLPYLVAAVRNESYSTLRRRKSELPLNNMTSESGVTLGDFGLGISDVGIPDIAKHLPIEQRDVLVLKLLYGYTFAEIALLTQSNAATAASRYRYALAALRKLLHGAGS
jgi:RNA polymerase sigma-70 factor (ECF subfamily)